MRRSQKIQNDEMQASHFKTEDKREMQGFKYSDFAAMRPRWHAKFESSLSGRRTRSKNSSCWCSDSPRRLPSECTQNWPKARCISSLVVWTSGSNTKLLVPPYLHPADLTYSSTASHARVSLHLRSISSLRDAIRVDSTSRYRSVSNRYSLQLV